MDFCALTLDWQGVSLRLSKSVSYTKVLKL